MARVLVPIAEGCEELEAVTIIDLLRRANIDVITAGLISGPVTCSRNTVLLPDTNVDEVIDSEFDMIVLPGGLPGSDHLNNDPRIHSLLKRAANNGKYTAAICAAPKVLASIGLLDGKKATSYPGALNVDALPTTEITSEAVSLDGKVITSRGPGTAMDFALQLIEILEGPDARKAVEEPLLR
jgi:4-methyl-5(b-hydroxyethyl)-thiazole monophosphate biosynthesis